MRSSLPFVLALSLASSRAAADEAPPPVAPPPVAPPPVAPPPVAPRAFPIELTHAGVAAIAISAFSASVLAACSDVSTGPGLVRCRWASGGIAIGFALTSVPFFVLGARQDRTAAWLSQRLVLTAGTRGAAIGWTASF